MKTILKAKNLEKEYIQGRKTFKAIDGISFTINRGESVSISGKSGSGKTTLMNIMGALEIPTRGEVFLSGEEYGSVSEGAAKVAVRRKMGFVFQSHNLLGDFTALENVSFPCLISGVSRSESYMRAERFLRRVGLEDKLRSFPDELSGGEQQRVAVARALVMEPEVVLADEPTGNLDPKTSMLVADVMFAMKESFNTTLVVATHSKYLSERFGRNFTISEGRLVNA